MPYIAIYIYICIEICIYIYIYIYIYVCVCVFACEHFHSPLPETKRTMLYVLSANYCTDTARHVASMRGHAGCVALLLECGAFKVDEADQSGATAMAYACENGHLEALGAPVGFLFGPTAQGKDVYVAIHGGLS